MEPTKIIFDKILAYHRKKLTYLVSASIINVIVILFLIWSSTSIIDSVYFFSTSGRWFLLITNLIISFAVITYLIFLPIYSFLKRNKNSNYTLITKEIGTFYPEIRDKLTNAYQLCKDNLIGVSASLKNYAIEDFSRRIAYLNFAERIRFIKFIIPLPLIFIILMGGAVLIFTMNDSLIISFKRIINPGGEYTVIPTYQFNVIPGNAEVIVAQDLQIQTSYQGPALKKCMLEYRTLDELLFQTTPMSYKDGFYYYTLKNLHRPIEYQIKGITDIVAEWDDKLVSERYQIQIIIPPDLYEVAITISPPGYTNLPRQILEKNVGDIVAYPGSKIDISARANKPIQQANLIFSDSTEITFDIRENRLSAEFIINETGTYHFRLKDQEGIKNQNPIEYSITALKDIYPSVAIIEPGVDVEISVDAALNLVIEGNDDFGFNQLQLHYQIISAIESAIDTTWKSAFILIPELQDKFFQQNFLWNFANISIGFDDEIKYFVSLTDNDQINGPKTSRSSEYFIRFPSLEQIFDEFAEKQSEAENDLEKVARESAELQEKLEEISRELKRENQIDWERKKQIESTLDSQKNIQEKLEKIQKDLDEAIEKLEQNQLLSPEILEKYRQLQDLFQEIATPELLEAMKELQQALEELSNENAQNSLQKFKINQEQFSKTLDRTLELFKRIQLEQELDQLVQMARKMVKEQNEISKELQDNNDLTQEKVDNLNNREDGQIKNLEQTSKLIDNLLQEQLMQEYSKTKDLLQLSREQIDQKQLSSHLRSLQKMLSILNGSGALEKSQQLGQDMQELASNIERAQNEMLQSAKEQIMQQMYKITENLLKLSSDQEELMEETAGLSNYSDQFYDVASQQQKIADNMGRVVNDIIDLSQKTFFIAPELSRALGKATGNMRKSLSELEDRNQRNASKHQTQAMAALNEAVMELQNSAQLMAQSNSALGFEQFLQRMQQLSGKQGQLNQQGLDLFNSRGNQGSLTIEQQGQLKRMAAEQRAIQKALEQLHDQTGNRSDILGRLDNMAEEMDKVVKDLEQLKIDRKTIERQQQILSRMLDAQKSVREKEYSRERKAEVGKEYARKSPSDNLETTDKRAERLRLNLMQALKEGYHPDYEKLIEDYFRRLNQKDLKE